MARPLKLLHTADWHLGRRLEGRGRHEEQERVLDEICRIAEDEAVDAVLIAGDVFDTFNPPAESEALFYDTMTRLAAGGRRAVVVIAGNHDSPDRLIASDPYARALGITTIGYPKDVPECWDFGADRVACIESAPSFVRLRTPATERVLTVLALPYPSETRLREILTHDLADEGAAAVDYNGRVRDLMRGIATRFVPGEASVVASHLFLRDGIESDSERQIQVGGTYAVEPGSFPAEACYVALGHLHRGQQSHGERDLPIRYSGSILQYSFSEAEQAKSVTIVELNGERPDVRTVPLGSGRMLERWSGIEGREELERRLAAASPESWLSITVALDEPMTLDYMVRLRTMHPGIIHCIPEYRLSTESAGGEARVGELPLDEQFRRFVGSKHGEPPSDAVVKLFMELATGGAEPGEGEL